MNYFRPWGHLLALSVLVSGMVSCESAPTVSTRKSTGFDSDLGSVRDLSNDDFARKAIAAQSEIEAGRAPGACTALLLSEGKDLYVNESVMTDDSKLMDAVCSLDDMQIAHFLKESHNQKQSDSHSVSLLVDAVIKKDSMKGDLRYNDTSSNEYSDDFARSDASVVRRVFCSNRSAESFKASASESFKSIVSPITLEKFNACVRAKSYGLYCDAALSGDEILVTVRWEPTDLVRDVLPVVALDWGAASGFQAKGELPKVLGIGSGYSVGFKRDNESSGKVIGVTGHDRGHNFNFSCRVDLDKKLTTATWRKTRRAECGIELARSGEGIECGVKSYKALRSAVCGVESYKLARSRACGVERYNEKHDCDICGQSGVFGGCNKCAHISFGVAAYRECSDQSHGVLQYTQCEHPTHGAETYHSCRHPSFGVELYRECEETP